MFCLKWNPELTSDLVLLEKFADLELNKAVIEVIN